MAATPAKAHLDGTTQKGGTAAPGHATGPDSGVTVAVTAPAASAPSLPPRPPGPVVWKQAVIITCLISSIILSLTAGDVLGMLGRAGIAFPVSALFLIPVVVGVELYVLAPIAMRLTCGWAMRPDCPRTRAEPCRCLEDGWCACRPPRGRSPSEEHIAGMHDVVHSTSRGVRALEAAVVAMASRLEADASVRKRVHAPGPGPDEEKLLGSERLFEPTLVVRLTGSEEEARAWVDGREGSHGGVSVRVTSAGGCAVLTARGPSVRALAAWRDGVLPSCGCAAETRLLVHGPAGAAADDDTARGSATPGAIDAEADVEAGGGATESAPQPAPAALAAEDVMAFVGPGPEAPRGRPPQRPYLYKIHTMVCVGLYPCLVLVGGPIGSSVTAMGAHPLLGSFVTVVVAVVLLTWIGGPLVSRSMQPWLSDPDSGECGCAGPRVQACCRRGCIG